MLNISFRDGKPVPYIYGVFQGFQQSEIPRISRGSQRVEIACITIATVEAGFPRPLEALRFLLEG